ncbi:MAG: biotin--[acetyl-CoA-carboxylase] ligase [Defluviicoccus sp.]
MGLVVPGGMQLIPLGRVDSTNEEAIRRCRAGAADGCVVWAEQQSQGRGRRGRSWLSPRGNLYVSIVVRPRVPSAAYAQLSFVAGLAVADAVAAHLPEASAVGCKWPNDVLVCGRKVAGLLLESGGGQGSGGDWLVAGIGVNVAWAPKDDAVLYPATALAAEGGTATVPDVLTSLLPAFARWRSRWEEEGFAAIRSAWRVRAHGLGAAITVRLEAETLSGIFRDLDPAGALILEQDTGLRTITAGDVFPAQAATERAMHEGQS